jgi:hypothetical protein
MRGHISVRTVCRYVVRGQQSLLRARPTTIRAFRCASRSMSLTKRAGCPFLSLHGIDRSGARHESCLHYRSEQGHRPSDGPPVGPIRRVNNREFAAVMDGPADWLTGAVF